MKKLLPPVLFASFAASSFALDALWPEASVLATPYNHIGWVPVALGITLLVVARLQFVRAKTNIYTFDEPGTLITSGAFAISRNPMYLGFALLLLGIAILQGSWLGLPLVGVFPIIADRWYIGFEERWLQAKFGQKFATYASQTRRWL